jgi:hypothetical protein
LNTGLWRIKLCPDKPRPAITTANDIYELHNTGALVNYMHKAMFSPTKSAFLQAVKKGQLTAWPGLTEEVINKHLKMTPATEIHSTTKNNIASDLEDEIVTPVGLGTKTSLGLR